MGKAEYTPTILWSEKEILTNKIRHLILCWKVPFGHFSKEGCAAILSSSGTAWLAFTAFSLNVALKPPCQLKKIVQDSRALRFSISFSECGDKGSYYWCNAIGPLGNAREECSHIHAPYWFFYRIKPLLSLLLIYIGVGHCSNKGTKQKSPQPRVGSSSQ